MNTHNRSSSPRTIVLVGLMGAGKSTIGRLLATHLGMPFKDSDHEIEARTGADIAWIFDKEGEAGFREREAAVLDDLLAQGPLVLATGGGIVMSKLNRKRLVASSDVIYLKASPDVLMARVKKDKKRPLLQVDNPAQVMDQLFNLRDPLYQEVADHTVITGTRSAKSVINEIVNKLS